MNYPFFMIGGQWISPDVWLSSRSLHTAMLAGATAVLHLGVPSVFRFFANYVRTFQLNIHANKCSYVHLFEMTSKQFEYFFYMFFFSFELLQFVLLFT